MTVRAWFTISALVLAALAAAFVFRLFAPVPAPEVVARAGEVRLDGEMRETCWPQRGGDVRCRRGDADPRGGTLPGRGTLRMIVTFPTQPEDGYVSITGPEDLRVDGWRRNVAYDLPPGDYEMTAQATYPGDAFVRYAFRFSVSRSGS